MGIHEQEFPGVLPVTGFPDSGDGAELAGQVFAYGDPIPAAIEAQVPADPVRVEFEERQSRVRRIWEVTKNAVKAAVITTELLPITNEGLRYGAFAYTQTVTHNPLVGAAVLGGTTMLVEGASAIASAKWVAQDKIKDVIDKVDDRLTDTKFAWMSPKRYIPENLRVSPVAEAGLAMTLGTLAVLEAKQRENPERTASQNLRHGLFTAGWLSGVFAIEGALLSKGIENPTNPGNVGLALLGVAGLIAFGKWAKKKYLGGNSEQPINEVNNE